MVNGGSVVFAGGGQFESNQYLSTWISVVVSPVILTHLFPMNLAEVKLYKPLSMPLPTFSPLFPVDYC